MTDWQLPSQPGPSSIPLYLVNGVATIWDAQVAATLHCVHNIGGLRVGTLPGVSQQNAFLGLPVTLMAEETAYLLQEGIAHLIPLNPSPTPPTDDLIEKHTQARITRVRAIEEAARLAEEKRVNSSRATYQRSGDEAKAKREARARAKAAQSGGTNSSELFDHDNEHENDKPGEPSSTQLQQRIKPSSTLAHTHFHPIPSHPHFPPSGIYKTPITSLPCPLFPFPSTKRDRALLKTFTTLMKRGYRMGLGPRFGGEYLVYPGDYLRYHAHFTSQVIQQGECIRPAEIVAWGRLGTGTKKAGLLCCVSDEQEEQEEGEEGVEFYSLEWANFG